MRRCVIIGGAGIGRYNRIRTYLQGDDFFICCDSGLKHQNENYIEPWCQCFVECHLPASIVQGSKVGT